MPSPIPAEMPIPVGMPGYVGGDAGVDTLWLVAAGLWLCDIGFAVWLVLTY